MFAYPCPNCAQRLLAPQERAGLPTICPKCLKPLTVPTPETKGDPFESRAELPHDPFSPSSASIDTPVPMNTSGPGTAPEYDLDLGLLESSPSYAAETAYTAVAEAGGPAVAVATLTAPARSRAGDAPPLPTVRKAFSAGGTGQKGRVQLEGRGMFGADVAAELSAAISLRMAPPPEAALDGRLVWLAWGTGVSLGLLAWVLGIWTSLHALPYVALVSAAMVLFGIAWRAYLSGKRGEWLAGLASALPPICFVQLFRSAGAHGRRPLAFVLGGLFLGGLFAAGPTVKASLDESIGPKTESIPILEPKKDEATEVRFTLAKLDELAATDAFGDGAEAEKTITQLKALLADANAERRAGALKALIVWSPEEGRKTAIEWLGSRTDRTAAKAALIHAGQSR